MADEQGKFPKEFKAGDLLLADDFNDLQDWVQGLHNTHVEDLHNVQNTGNKLVIKHENEDNPVAMIDGQTGNFFLGGNFVDGNLYCLTKSSDWENDDGESISIPHSSISLEGRDGKISAQKIDLSSELASRTINCGEYAHIGTRGDGEVLLFSSENFDEDASNNSYYADIALQAYDGSMRLGGNLHAGKLSILKERNINEMGTSFDDSKVSIDLNGENGNVKCENIECKNIRLDTNDGKIESNQQTILQAGGNRSTTPGKFFLFNYENARGPGENWASIALEASAGSLRLGGVASAGSLYLFKDRHYEERGTPFDNSTASIGLNGENGNIQCTTINNRRADFAEEFAISNIEIAVFGNVVVLDGEGSVRTSTEGYDRKVVGVISGAGDYKPGIVLDSDPSKPNRMPVSLMGKVYCKVDADYAPIELGDLLTTSATPGHAMKATDMTKAFGAVLGKAMAPLESGKGLIPIIVTLQ
jgi:hypothetical protein